MAKSARSKSKIAARNARRYTLGTDYQVTHAARLNHVASRLATRLNAPKEGEEDAAEEESKMEEERPAAPAPAPATAAAPLSTARRGDSSRKRWRRKQKRR